MEETQSEAMRTALASLLARYSSRRLWGLVHDAQTIISQKLTKSRFGFRDPRVRLQVNATSPTDFSNPALPRQSSQCQSSDSVRDHVIDLGLRAGHAHSRVSARFARQPQAHRKHVQGAGFEIRQHYGIYQMDHSRWAHFWHFHNITCEWHNAYWVCDLLVRKHGHSHGSASTRPHSNFLKVRKRQKPCDAFVFESLHFRLHLCCFKHMTFTVFLLLTQRLF